MDWNHLTKNPLITRLLELEEMGKVEAETQPSSQELAAPSEGAVDSILNLNKSMNCDKRKNFMMFQRMQSISIDCLRNVDDSVGSKVSAPLERRLSTGSVTLENDFLLKTPIVESSEKTHPSPQPPPQPVTVDVLMKQKLNEVLEEGILDSVLPYLVPKPLVTSSLLSPAPLYISKGSISSSDIRKGNSAQESQSNDNIEKGKNRAVPIITAADASKPE